MIYRAVYVNFITTSHVTNKSKTHYLVNVPYFHVSKLIGNAYTTFRII